MNFGEKIKKLRIENKWTQEFVAEKLNISVGAVSRYENGMYEPKSLDLIKDFPNLFNVSTDYLLGKEEHSTIDINDKVFQLLGINKEQYSNLSDNAKEQIKAFIKFVEENDKK